jgi:hypothetical protein
MNAQVGTGMANAYDYDSLDWQISVPWTCPSAYQ